MEERDRHPSREHAVAGLRTPSVRLLLTGLFFAGPGFLRSTGAADELGSDTDTPSLEELVRGYTASEFDRASRDLPRRPEPPVPTPVARQVSFRGRAFVDANGNGLIDRGEQVLSGVLLTDGEHVTRTTQDGHYEFVFDMPDEAHCRFVVATRPTGRAPSGSVFFRIPFAEAQTEYTADFGFVDDPSSRPGPFCFAAASDSQFTSVAQMIPIAKDFDQVTSVPNDAAFLVTAGDLTMQGTHWQWDMYDHIQAAANIPVYNGFGGHDGIFMKPNSTVNYELRIGPPYYSWDYAGVHFIQMVSETSYLLPKARARHERWVMADLQAIPTGTPVIVVAHYPLAPQWFDLRRAEGTNVVCQIAAHWHVVMSGSRNNVPVLISAPARGNDWGAYSRTYRRVHVDGTSVRSELVVAGQYERLRAFSPGPKTTTGRQPLMVLAYDTARKVASVRCRLRAPDGAVVKPTLVPGGAWSWHGELLLGQSGTWRVDLEATDSAGISWQRQQLVVVEKRPETPMTASGAGAEESVPWLLAGEPPRRLRTGPGRDLRPRWILHTGATHVLHSSPVAAAGRIYVAVTDPNAHSPRAGVLCVDAQSGREVWRSQSPRGDLRGTVTVHQGKVYAVTAESWVCAFDAASGELLWSRPLSEEYRAGRPMAGNQHPPVPTRRGLLVSDWRSPQYLLDYDTGKQLALLNGNVGHYAAFATVFDDVMFCARRGGALAIRVPSGETVWSVPEPSRATSAGIVVNGKLIYAAQPGVKALDPETGTTVWDASVPNRGYLNPVPVVWDDLVLMNGVAFTALDLATGKPQWSVECGQDADRFVRSQRQALAGSSTPLVAGDLAYFGHDDTSIRAVDREGSVVWEYRLGTPVKTAPAVHRRLLYVHDYAGNLWCFEPVSGIAD